MDHKSANPRIVIVGAAHAGGRAAEALRVTGFKGAILMIGAEHHPPYERPPLSKEFLAGTSDGASSYLHPLPWYDEHGIALRLGTRVGAIDRKAQRLLIEDGGSEPYDLLLLTTGARARRLRIAGAESPRVFYIRDISDALRLRTRLVAGARVVSLHRF